MEIILKKDVKGLGIAEDLVSVKAGYARNFLIPQGIAEAATSEAKTAWESRREEREANVLLLLKNSKSQLPFLNLQNFLLVLKLELPIRFLVVFQLINLAQTIQDQFSITVDVAISFSLLVKSKP